MSQEGISLNKYISSTGFCSRREADKLIEQARVTINEELVLTSTKVYAGDKVAIDGEPLKSSAKRPIYIVLNKPVGVTSTTDIQDKTNIISFVNHPKRIFPIGRLDKDSDGLIFLTNDGDIVNKILRASNHHEKEYIVTVDKAITAEFISKMSNGIPMLGTVTNKCFVRQEGGRRFRIILTQGLNRQIRRMCDHLDYKVMTLTRVRIMNVELGNLPTGKWRYLTPQETDKITEMVSSSEKTYTATPREVKRAQQYIPRKNKAASNKEATGAPQYTPKKSKAAPPKETKRVQQNVPKKSKAAPPKETKRVQQNVPKKSKAAAPKETKRVQQNVPKKSKAAPPKETKRVQQSVPKKSKAAAPKETKRVQQSVPKKSKAAPPKETKRVQQNIPKKSKKR